MERVSLLMLTPWVLTLAVGCEQEIDVADAPVATTEKALVSSTEDSLNVSAAHSFVSAAVDGDLLVLGAEFATAPNPGGGSDLAAGKAFLVSRLSGVWQTDPAAIQELYSSTAAFLDSLGTSVAIEGQTVVVGAQFADSPKTKGTGCRTGKNDGGAVYVYVGSGGAFSTTEDYVLGPDCYADSEDIDNDGNTTEVFDMRDEDAEFGNAVAIAGDLIVVGSHANPINDGDDFFRDAAGNVLFAGDPTTAECMANTCTNTQISGCCFTSDECNALLSAGKSVCTSRLNHSDANNGGAAFVFARNNSGTWNTTTRAKLIGGDTEASDQNGTSVSVDGNTSEGYTVVTGAPQHNAGALDTGAVYVFAANIMTSGGGAPGGPGGPGGAGNNEVSVGWSQVDKLVAPDAAAEDRFGESVAISEGTLVVGAPDDDDTVSDSGSAYVYAYNGSNWSFVQKLHAFTPLENGHFGQSVDIDGDKITVAESSSSGSVYVYKRSGASFVEHKQLTPSSGGTPTDVAIDDTTVVTGFRANLSPQAGLVHEVIEIGNSCSSADDCDTGFCVDGVCCQTACGGGAVDDCEVCSINAGGSTDGQCGPIVDSVAAATTICRAIAGPCDQAESCAPNEITCPEDAIKPLGETCREIAGDCDLAEVCDGVSTACPADQFAASSTECRASEGPCDMAELCDGANADCPADAFVSVGTPCRSAAGRCDSAEVCSGASADCPPDTKVPSGMVCRASAGDCDAPETCDGMADTCPADLKLGSTTTCRSSAGSCDVPEVCDGLSDDCPADVLIPASTVCRPAAGACDVEDVCTGNSGTCPMDTVATVGTVCRSAVGDCDLQETCDGTSTDCGQDRKVASGTVCRMAVGLCDATESCDGLSDVCPEDNKQSVGTTCREAAGDCDTAESCDGLTDGCPADRFVPAGTECRAAAGDCDVAEVCTGDSNTCPEDARARAGTVCRHPESLCELAKTCDGVSVSCPDETAGCDDGLSCTEDSCDPSAGCKHTVVIGCSENGVTTVDENGGVAQSAGADTVVNFPPGAVAAATTITITELDETEISAATNNGVEVIASTVVDLHTDGRQRFNTPVELSIDVLPGHVAAEADELLAPLLSEETQRVTLTVEVFIATVNEHGNWEQVDGTAQQFTISLELSGLTPAMVETAIKEAIERQSSEIELMASLAHFSVYAAHVLISDVQKTQRADPAQEPQDPSSGNSSGCRCASGNLRSTFGLWGLVMLIPLLLARVRCRRASDFLHTTSDGRGARARCVPRKLQDSVVQRFQPSDSGRTCDSAHTKEG